VHGGGGSPFLCETCLVLKNVAGIFLWSVSIFLCCFSSPLDLVFLLVCYGAMSWLQVRRVAFIQLFWGLALAQGLTRKT
jgi:hypothetical protein